MTYEHLSPQHHATFLYDELAESVRVLYAPLFDSTHTHASKQDIELLIERIIAALHHDNALFNEARFRYAIVHVPRSKPAIRHGKLPPSS